MSTIGTVIDGVLRSDGTLELDASPRLPPGRVRVTVQPLVDGRTEAERLPDAPWLDDGIPAPFDLPRSGVAERVQPRAVAERLPELPTGMVSCSPKGPKHISPGQRPGKSGYEGP
jgi:hypothetical protein